MNCRIVKYLRFVLLYGNEIRQTIAYEPQILNQQLVILALLFFVILFVLILRINNPVVCHLVLFLYKRY